MDELLSLFDNDSPTSVREQPPEASQGSQAKRPSTTPINNDFTSSFGDAFATGTHTTHKTVTPSPAAKPLSSSHPQRDNNINSKKNNCNPQDPITQLRITNRHTSLSSMLDLFSPFQYKSCAMLAALSKQEWTAQVVKPSASSGGGVSGKTNLVTSGIITNEVSSRFSKSGRAYAMLNLGDLSSTTNYASSKSTTDIHPSVTVFLFGEAIRILNVNTKPYLARGYAVGILGPNVMPKDDNNKNSTSISLSVSDAKQIVLIGKAQDVDRCKGTTRKRTVGDYGPTFEDVRCGTLIDVRRGNYCCSHKRQGLASNGASGGGKSGSTAKNGKSNLTFMQKQRMTGNKTLNSQHPKMDNAISSNHGAQSRVSEALTQAGLMNSYNLQSSSLGGNVTKPATQLKRAPLHMKKSTTSQEIWSNTNTPLSSLNNPPEKRANPYHKAKSIAAPKRTSDDVLGAALQRKRPKIEGHSLSSLSRSASKQSNARPVKVFHTEGYDGSVQVPKPKPILFKSASSRLMSNPSMQSKRGLSTIEAQAILDKQKNLAALAKEQRVRKGTNVGITTIKKTHQTAVPKNSDDPFASIFAPNNSQPLDRDAILNAKSRFASSATAEEYARARSVVQQLEIQECETDKRKERKEKNSAKASIVTTGWVCKTCKSKTAFEPTRCVRSHHDVRQIRELKEKKVSVGTRKDRMERHGKEDTDGGLTLGSGLEWSGWRGGLG